MKKHFFLFILSLLPLFAQASTLIEDIYYNLNTSNKTAEVTSNPNKYTGDVIIPQTVLYDGEVYSITSIGFQAFYNCSALTSVTIPDGVTSIDSSAFEYCSSLTSFNIPESVTHIGSRAFNGTAWFNNQPDGLVYIGKIAYKYKGTMPENTSIIFQNGTLGIADNAFSGCSGLISITIPEGVTYIGYYSFSNCKNLSSVTIPSSVTKIEEFAFVECSGLTSVHISDIAAWCNISFGNWNGANPLCNAHHLFLNETEVTDLVIPDGVTSIANLAFVECSGLTSVTIPSSVTCIGEGAFYGCSGLAEITIPEGVTSIGSSSFAYCTGLNDVYCLPIEVPSTKTDAFNNSNISNVTLHVFESAYDDYSRTFPWRNFGNIVCIPPPCETPVISYVGGTIVFTCDMEGVEFNSTVTSADTGNRKVSEIDVCASIDISVYATKEGYSPSETTTATLCWVEVEPVDGVATGTLEISAVPVLVKSRGEVITVEGVGNNTEVKVYTSDGMFVGSSTAVDHTATIPTSLSPGTVAVVDLSKKAVKVVIK